MNSATLIARGVQKKKPQQTTKRQKEYYITTC